LGQKRTGKRKVKIPLSNSFLKCFKSSRKREGSSWNTK
jgi:hypothetical protein